MIDYFEVAKDIVKTHQKIFYPTLNLSALKPNKQAAVPAGEGSKLSSPPVLYVEHIKEE